MDDAGTNWEKGDDPVKDGDDAVEEEGRTPRRQHQSTRGRVMSEKEAG